LLYKEGTKATCDEPLCCREDVGKPKEGEKLAGYWGSATVCDLPERTLE
jgi:sphingomyelin phosphodiesterase